MRVGVRTEQADALRRAEGTGRDLAGERGAGRRSRNVPWETGSAGAAGAG